MNHEYDNYQPSADRHREVFIAGGDGPGQGQLEGRGGVLNVQNFNAGPQDAYRGPQDVYGNNEFASPSRPNYHFQ